MVHQKVPGTGQLPDTGSSPTPVVDGQSQSTNSATTQATNGIGDEAANKLVEVCLSLPDPSHFRAIFKPLVTVMPRDSPEISPLMRQLLAYLIEAPDGRLYQKDWEKLVEESIHALIKVSPALLEQCWQLLDASMAYFEGHGRSSQCPPGAMKLWLDVYLRRNEHGDAWESTAEADGRQISKRLLQNLREVFAFDDAPSLSLVKLYAQVRASHTRNVAEPVQLTGPCHEPCALGPSSNLPPTANQGSRTKREGLQEDVAMHEFVDRTLEALGGLSRTHLSDEDSALPVTFRASTRINLLENLRNEDAGQYWESRGHPDTLTVLKPHGLLLNHIKLKTHPYKHGYEPKDLDVRLQTPTGRSLFHVIRHRSLPKDTTWVSLFDRDRDLGHDHEGIQELLKEVHVVITILQNWDGGANCKINCVRAFGFEPVEARGMDVRDRLRLSMPLLLLNHTTHTLHTNILRCNKEPDERCTRAVKALSRLPFYRARILSTWTSLLLQRCSAMQPLAPTGDAEEEEDVGAQLEGMSHVLARTEVERRYAEACGLSVLLPTIDQQAATLWRQRLENSRLVERFLHSCGEGREGLDGPLSLNIRRILGLVLSNTSKDQELVRLKKVWVQGVMDATLKVLMEHLTCPPAAAGQCGSEPARALLSSLQQLGLRIQLLHNSHDGRFACHLGKETAQGFAGAWRRLSRGAAARLAHQLAVCLDSCADPYAGVNPSARTEAVTSLANVCGASMLDCLQDVAWFYERYLARRLLRRRTLGPAAEESLLLEVGWAWDDVSMGRALHMIYDLRWTQELLTDMYHRDLSSGLRDELLCTSSPLFAPQRNPPVAVLIVAPGRWPSGCLQSGPLRLPSHVTAALDHLEQLYTRQTCRTDLSDGAVTTRPSSAPSPPADGPLPSADAAAAGLLEVTWPGRRLIHFPRAGSVLLTCTFQRRPRALQPPLGSQRLDLLASPTQALALIALAKKPNTAYSTRELAVSLGYDACSHDDLCVLTRELCPLTHPSTGPLLLRRREWPRGTDTEGGALWQLNDHFGDEAPESVLSCCHNGGCYTLPEMAEAEGNSGEPWLEQLHVAKALGWRQDLVAAACARVAKRMRAGVAYEAFVSLVRSELQPRLGLVGREDIVAAIDSLMRQDILTLTAIAKSRRETWPEGANEASAQVVAVVYTDNCASPSSPSPTSPLRPTEGSPLFLTELGLGPGDVQSSGAFREAALRLAGKRGVTVETSSLGKGERERAEQAQQSLRQEMEKLTEELNNLEMAKIMVEMDPSQARGLDSMQQNIRERITELEQRLQTGGGPPSPLADGSQPLWPTTMRALSSFETTVEQALVGMTGLLRASVLQWLGSVREALKREKAGSLIRPLPPLESWLASSPPCPLLSAAALRLLSPSPSPSPRLRAKLLRLLLLLQKADKDRADGQALYTALTTPTADHSRNHLLRSLLTLLRSPPSSSSSSSSSPLSSLDAFLSPSPPSLLARALLSLPITLPTPQSLTHLRQLLRERLAAEVDQAIATAELHLGMAPEEAPEPSGQGQKEPSAFTFATLAPGSPSRRRGESWDASTDLVFGQVGEVDASGREAQQALEWVRGGLAEVLREKRDAEQQGRRFEEETKDEARSMLLHAERHGHRRLFVSLDLSDDVQSLSPSKPEVKSNEADLPPPPLVPRSTSLTRALSSDKSILRRAWAVDTADTAMTEASLQLQDAIHALSDMFDLDTGSAAHLLCARSFHMHDVVQDLLEDREETLSRAYLPRDGAACYVLRDPPVSPPTTHLDCPCACMLCGDEGSGERLVAVRRCGHVLCGDCVASHAKARVESHPGNPVTCPLCPVKTASALTMTLLQALGLGAPTSILLTGIRKVVGEAAIAAVKKELQDAIQRTGVRPKTVSVAEGVVGVEVEVWDDVARTSTKQTKDTPALQGYAVLELCSEHDAQRLHDCINTHPSTSPSSPQGTMAKGESAQGPIAGTRNLQDLRAVFGGWAAVQERAVFKWFSDGRHLHCRASKDCPGIVQVPGVYGLSGQGGGGQGAASSEGGCLPLRCRLCDATFCSSRQCSRRSHAPATCLMMQQWEAAGGIYPDMESSKANEVLIKVDSKPCPRCHIPVHRTQGCNQMTCTCLAKFCYQCGSDWDRRHDAAGHFACPVPRDIQMRDSGNFAELNREATKLLEVMEERRIDACKLRDLAFTRSSGHSVFLLQRRVKLQLLHASLHQSLMDLQLLLFGACVLSHYIPASGFEKARNTVQALQARLTSASVREDVQTAVTDLKEMERAGGVGSDVQRKILAYLWDKEGHLRRAVTVLQRIMTLVVEEMHLVARTLTLEAQRATDGDPESAAGSGRKGRGQRTAAAAPEVEGVALVALSQPLHWDVASIAVDGSMRLLETQAPGAEATADEGDGGDDDSLPFPDLSRLHGDDGY